MDNRNEAAVDIARSGGALALDYFRRLGSLVIEDKGPQDFVSEADKAVEVHVRKMIEEAFPADGIVGEEDAPKPSRSGYTWVIDPIDGTTNFISAIPAWTVVIAVVKDDQTQIGVTCDPIHEEMYLAIRGAGAWLNDERLVCPTDTEMTRGSIGTGFSNRISKSGSVRLIDSVLTEGGIFHRNASGALSLAYVAAGRLIGYVEEHMNAWDCLAGQLLVAEAGGCIEEQSADDMMANGGARRRGKQGRFQRSGANC
ncbi:inositol monophosphatase [uncultured Roseobacter sp.]|uniref:inositol monophosphatase family protein n=1 Tax=uncultured Roseobacter sp. TaxID=114847 RepID=UPI002628C465|nr:inositol monophosphatase [uncultured Roseobacter sp.]